MLRLIALDLPGGPAFTDALRRAWDDGNAVVPIDQRLPAPAKAALIAGLRPHRVVTADGIAAEDSDPPGVEPGDALVLATSGTTGEPKAIVHTHDGLRAHAEAVTARLGIDPDRDRWLACLPLGHIGGLGVLVRSLLTGTPCDVLPGFDAEVVASAPERWGTTAVSLVPTALDRIDSSPFRWVVLGGSGDQVDRPDNVVRTYGLTETGGGIVYGDTPLDGVELRIGPGGDIEVRGPMLARGRRLPDGSVVRLTDSAGWLRTGDRGFLTHVPGGPPRLTVLGRGDDLIVTGGQNVWPEPVEAVIAEHPAVAEVGVVGRPDPEWGQVVVAAVVLRHGSDAPSIDELRDHVKASLPAYAAPREVEVVESLPRTPLGKLRRRALLGLDEPGDEATGERPHPADQ